VRHILEDMRNAFSKDVKSIENQGEKFKKDSDLMKKKNETMTKLMSELENKLFETEREKVSD
jgi:hypothetical protein